MLFHEKPEVQPASDNVRLKQPSQKDFSLEHVAYFPVTFFFSPKAADFASLLEQKEGYGQLFRLSV